ncbi:MAG: hypothetical protein AAGI07_12295 [Bacteroidota bacterium]
MSDMDDDGKLVEEYCGYTYITKIFIDNPDTVDTFYPISKEELALVQSFLPNGNKLLVTTKNLYSLYEGKIQILNYKEYVGISDFSPPLEPIHLFDKKHPFAKVILSSSSGNDFIFEIERGKGFLAVLNCLTFFPYHWDNPLTK